MLQLLLLVMVEIKGNRSIVEPWSGDLLLEKRETALQPLDFSFLAWILVWLNFDETFDVELSLWLLYGLDDCDFFCRRRWDEFWRHFHFLFRSDGCRDSKVILVGNRRWWGIVWNVNWRMWLHRWCLMIKVIWWGEESIHVGQCSKLFVQIFFIGLVELEALPTSQKTSISKHVECFRMKRPIRALARSVGTSRNFHEAIVEAQIVS